MIAISKIFRREIRGSNVSQDEAFIISSVKISTCYHPPLVIYTFILTYVLSLLYFAFLVLIRCTFYVPYCSRSSWELLLHSNNNHHLQTAHILYRYNLQKRKRIVDHSQHHRHEQAKDQCSGRYRHTKYKITYKK